MPVYVLSCLMVARDISAKIRSGDIEIKHRRTEYMYINDGES